MKITSRKNSLNLTASIWMLLCWGFLIGIAGASLSAQTREAAGERTVSQLTIEFIELENVSREVVLANMQLREGDRYDENIIDQDIRNLYRTNLFEYIEVRRAFPTPETVELVFVIRPKYRVRAIVLEGNESFSNRRMRNQIEMVSGAALDERRVRLDSQKIFEYYQSKGFPQVVVDFEITRDPTRGTGTVIHRITEGPRVRVRQVNFTGNDSVSDRRLRKTIETRRWTVFSFLTGRGRFKDDIFDDDLDLLRAYYREQGFLDVEIDAEEVTFRYPNERRMDIQIPIREGRRYEVGEISLHGFTLYTEEELRQVLRLQTGDTFRPSFLDRDTEALRDYFGRDGYLDTMVRPTRIPNVETGRIDIRYDIAEGGKVFVESIIVEGNTKTKSVVLIRELGLRPGDVFDSTRMKASQRRLQNTRFFEQVNVSPEPTTVEGRRNLKINVTEARTGNLTFGVGFSSLERAIVFAELTQGNFDLFHPRGGFQGAGQKLRLRLELGTRSSQAILAFEEPWLFQQQLALGFQIYRTESEFFSRNYTELRTGFEVYLRKRLIELVEGRLSYTFEIVDISDVGPNTPLTIQRESGERSVSKVGFSLLRDTRDSLMITTRGNRYELFTELAGGPFGADTNYYRIEGRGAQFFRLSDLNTMVFSVIGRTGVVQNFGDSDDVPFFDRYFLGGPRTLRGFRFRDVGPREEGEPVGGKTFGFLSLEYSLEIVEPIRFAVFYDAGFVNQDYADWSFDDFNDNIGFGFRVQVLGAPLLLDYGIPLTTDDENDTGGQFNFSFGTRF